MTISLSASRKTLLIACVTSLLAVPAFAQTKIGAVEKIQADVLAAQGPSVRRLTFSDDVLFKDKLRTGPNARLEAKLADDTTLTLGENGRLTVDEFVYRPGERGGKLAMTVTQGAFLFVGGKVEEPSGGNVTIRTPVGTLGVRGTTVWGGYIDGGYGVLVLSGEVDVMTKKGRVKLAAGQGTMVYTDKAPARAGAWPAERTARAVKTISFGVTPDADLQTGGIIRKP